MYTQDEVVSLFYSLANDLQKLQNSGELEQTPVSEQVIKFMNTNIPGTFVNPNKKNKPFNDSSYL